jgi:hypothetical protein
MQGLCEALIERYFDASLEMAFASQDKDEKCVEAFSARNQPIEARASVVADWIRLYKINRVKWNASEDDSAATFADAAAGVALQYSDAHPSLAPEGVPAAYAELRNSIGQRYFDISGKDRTFRSLTGKLLWCAYPDSAPIYDDFSSRAVTTLIRIYKAHKAKDRYNFGLEEEKYNNVKNWETLPKAKKDAWWYEDFYRSHRRLFEHFQPVIVHCAAALKDTDIGRAPTTFRLFDKFLWLFGNNDLDYSLLGTEEKVC